MQRKNLERAFLLSNSVYSIRRMVMLQYRCKACLLAIIQLAAISGTMFSYLRTDKTVVVLSSFFNFFWVFYSLSLLINSCSFREIYFGYSNFSSSARTRFVFIFVLKRVVAPRCLLCKGSKSFNRVLPLQLLPKLTFETNIVDRKYEFLGQLK